MKRRISASALVALCVLALAACSGSGKPAARESTPTTGSSTTSTSSAPPVSSTAPTSAVTSTAVRYAAPVGPQGRQLAGVTVSAGGSGMCEPGSDVIANANVYRCFAGHLVYDPCWALTGGAGSGSAVLCQQDPWSEAAIKITLSSPVQLTVSKAPDLEDPWAVELTDGQHCLALQGAHSSFHGAVVNYACAPLGASPALSLLGHPDRASTQWSFSSVTGQGPSDMSGPTVRAKAAYFAGPPPAVAAACQGSQLAVSAGARSGGLGHDGLPILFKNTGTATCGLHGYPGVAALDPAGNQAAQAVRSPNGYLGGLPPGAAIPTVTLAPGGTASALVESTDNPVGTATSCPTYKAFIVTPPNTTTSVRISASLIDCSGLSVHPVVPGSTGS